LTPYGVIGISLIVSELPMIFLESPNDFFQRIQPTSTFN